MTEMVILNQIKMKKIIFIFISLLAITACEFNDKVGYS